MKYSNCLSNYRWFLIGVKTLIFLVIFMSLSVSPVVAMNMATLNAMRYGQVKKRLRALYDLTNQINRQLSEADKPFRMVKKLERWRRAYVKKNKPKYDRLKAEYDKLRDSGNRSQARLVYLVREMRRIRQPFLQKRDLYQRYLNQCTTDRRKKVGELQSLSEKLVIEINKCRASLNARS